MGQLAIPLIALAASGAGAGLQISAADTAASNENQAVANQIAQQNQFGKQAQKVVQPNIARSSAPNAQQQLQTAASDQLAKYSQLTQQPTTTAASATPQNRVVSAGTGAQIGAQQDAAAKLAGYGSWENAQSINDQNVANQLGVINLESAGAGATLPAVLSQAQGSGATQAGIGSLLNTGGGLLGTYAAQQPFSAALKNYLGQQQYNAGINAGE